MKATVSGQRRHRGFTVLEMTVALAMSMGIAGALIGLLQLQISFSRILNDFQFLRDEAPHINTLLTNIVNKADQYRIYPDLASATSETGAVRSEGKSLRMRLRHPDGTTDSAIIAFELQNDAMQLNFYFRDKLDSSWPSTPSWTISSTPEVVTFDNSTGVLLVTLTGPKGEEITYAGNPD